MTDPTNGSAANARRRFVDPNRLQIAMTIGGIGAGCICLNGEGGLQDFAIHLKPGMTALPDGWGTPHSAFALIHVKAGHGREAMTCLIEGPFPIEKICDQSVQAQGYRHGGHEGLPRFADCLFEAEFPFGHVHLADAELPIAVKLKGWNPFIPLDDVNSSLPAIFLDYKLENKSPEPVSFEFSFHCSSLTLGAGDWKGVRAEPFAALGSEPTGVSFTNTDNPNAETFASAAFTVVNNNPAIKASWFRGVWFDALSALWREVSTGAFRPRGPGLQGEIDGRNGASIMVRGTLQSGETITYPIVLTWHFPKLYRNWKIRGDTEWLARLYPFSKRGLDYCISLWDPDECGALVEQHHNTYDIEFWGPDSMCMTISEARMGQRSRIPGTLLFCRAARRRKHFDNSTLTHCQE